MKPSISQISLFAGGALLLCSCFTPQPRNVAFSEASFAGYAQSGSGSVSGRAINDDGIHTADERAVVKLMPVNAYTNEIVQRRYTGGEHLEKADPRFAKYVRKTHPDDQGNFTFTHLPGGDYYVSCDIIWEAPGTSTDSNGSVSYSGTVYVRRAYARISVRQGQATRVTDWRYGS